ncbi:MAG: metallophosphoesterase family protein [Clostridiales bacterium]|nr:metallophosphoesterase family protein [Clostridiales bacterium]
MKIAFVADLHGNWPATCALEADLRQQKPDRIVCLGDTVGKGPSNDKTFDWAMSRCDLVIGGNWDYGVGEQAFPNDEYYWNQLGPERLRVLRNLPRESEMMLSGRRVRLMHGRPVMDTLITVKHDLEAIQAFFQDAQGKPFDVVLYADAHRQAMRTVNPGLFINTGSVGNAMGVTCCCYAIVEAEPGETPAPFEVRLRQLPYDREQAIRDAQAAPGVPRIETYINEIRTGVYSR